MPMGGYWKETGISIWLYGVNVTSLKCMNCNLIGKLMKVYFDQQIWELLENKSFEVEIIKIAAEQSKCD